jgi:hypothetical protein
MTTMSSKSLVFVAILSVVGCASYRPTMSSDEFPGSWAHLVKRLVKQAPFDLNCPVEQLTFKNVTNSTSGVGVIGCGKRASYKYVDPVGWILNVVSQDQPAPGPEPSSDLPSE